ncbi:MAG: hypothetical protein QM778_18155 [Myxococcales bacterium]
MKGDGGDGRHGGHVVLIVLSLVQPAHAYASDTRLALPILGMPILALIAVSTPVVAAFYADDNIPRWLHVLLCCVMALVALPAAFMAAMCVSVLDGPHANIAGTYLAAFLAAVVGVAYCIRVRLRVRGTKRRR